MAVLAAVGRVHLQHRLLGGSNGQPFKIVYDHNPPTIRSYELGETHVATVAKNMADHDELLADVRYRLEQARRSTNATMTCTAGLSPMPLVTGCGSDSATIQPHPSKLRHRGS